MLLTVQEPARGPTMLKRMVIASEQRRT